jgi:hypothetical protein
MFLIGHHIWSRWFDNYICNNFLRKFSTSIFFTFFSKFFSTWIFYILSTCLFFTFFPHFFFSFFPHFFYSIFFTVFLDVIHVFLGVIVFHTFPTLFFFTFFFTVFFLQKEGCNSIAKGTFCPCKRRNRKGIWAKVAGARIM